MVQLKVLTAHHAPAVHNVRKLPCLIGRSSSAGVRLEAPGVWDEHLNLNLDSDRRFTAQVCGGALLSVNGVAVQKAVLRNGDTLEFGSVKMQFWLGQTQQRGFRTMEALTWAVLAVVCITQIAVVYAMLR
jgi:hypothetical protein